MTQDALKSIQKRGVTFSLRTLFFLVTCAAVFLCGTRCGDTLVERLLTGATLLSLFSTLWSFMRGRRSDSAALLVTTLLLAVFLPLVGQPRGESPGAYCRHGMHILARALSAYEADHGSLPPAFSIDSNGKPLLSWRTAILPYLEESQIQQQLKFDEPWDGPANMKLAQIAIRCYQCPQHSTPADANYLAVVGLNTAWPGAVGRKTSELKDPAKTILLIEVPNSNVNWLEPRDLTIEQIKRTGLKGLLPTTGEPPHRHGFNVVFADGHTETLPADIDPKVVATMLDIDPASAASK